MGEQQQHLACLFPQRLRNHISNDPCWRDLVKQCWCESPWERAAASSAKPQRRGRGQLPPSSSLRPPAWRSESEEDDGGDEEGRQALCVITQSPPPSDKSPYCSEHLRLSDSRLISITGSVGGVRLTDEARLAQSLTSECVQLLSHTEAKCILLLFFWNI